MRIKLQGQHHCFTCKYFERPRKVITHLHCSKSAKVHLKAYPCLNFESIKHSKCNLYWIAINHLSIKYENMKVDLEPIQFMKWRELHYH